jgi:hypothetical protein
MAGERLTSPQPVIGRDSDTYNSFVSVLNIVRQISTSPELEFRKWLSHLSFQIVTEPARRSAVCDHHRMIVANLACVNRKVSRKQTLKHSGFFFPGYEPQYAPRSIENRIRKSHPPPALIGSGQGDVYVFNIAHGISGD